MGSYSWYWLETRVPIPVVWRVGWVAGTHRLDSAGFWWSGMVAERRGLQLQLGSSHVMGFQVGVMGDSGGKLATVGTWVALSSSLLPPHLQSDTDELVLLRRPERVWGAGFWRTRSWGQRADYPRIPAQL